MDTSSVGRQRNQKHGVYPIISMQTVLELLQKIQVWVHHVSVEDNFSSIQFQREKFSWSVKWQSYSYWTILLQRWPMAFAIWLFKLALHLSFKNYHQSLSNRKISTKILSYGEFCLPLWTLLHWNKMTYSPWIQKIQQLLESRKGYFRTFLSFSTIQSKCFCIHLTTYILWYYL